MLTKQQFERKHQAKFAKLSKQEKEARYRNYVASYSKGKKAITIRKSPGVTRGPPQRALALSQCSLEYAQALIDPFHLGSLPCIPDEIVLPSYKLRTYTRGTFAAGTAGAAWICVDPWLLGVRQTPCGFVTNSSYTNPDFVTPNVTTPPPGVVPISSNSPLNAGRFDPTVENMLAGRLVGAGVRVRYISSEFNRGGLMVCYRDPQNRDIDTQTMNSLLAFQEAATVPVSRNWHYVVHRPADVKDLEYDSGAFTSYAPTYSLLILITGAVPSTAFEFEAVGFYEFTGAVLPSLTASHADSVGLSVVRSALPLTSPTASPESTFSSFLNSLGGIARSTLSTITSVAGGVGPIVEEISSVASPVMKGLAGAAEMIGPAMRLASAAAPLMLL